MVAVVTARITCSVVDRLNHLVCWWRHSAKMGLASFAAVWKQEWALKTDDVVTAGGIVQRSGALILYLLRRYPHPGPTTLAIAGLGR